MKSDPSQNTKSRKLRSLAELFFTFLKIGLFTFGGGYAMISMIENEFVEKKRWLTQIELMEIVTIAESTPGPIAVNSATYVGYRVCGFFGSLFATLAVCIPSFVIIYIISIFYDTFMQLTAVAYAFRGIQAGVALMITTAGIRMFRKTQRDKLFWPIFCVAFGVAVLVNVFQWNFSSVYLILIGGAIGIVAQIIQDVMQSRKATPPAATSAPCDPDATQQTSPQENLSDSASAPKEDA